MQLSNLLTMNPYKWAGTAVTGAIVPAAVQLAKPYLTSLAETTAYMAASAGIATAGYCAGRKIYHADSTDLACKLDDWGFNPDRTLDMADAVKTGLAFGTFATSLIPLAYTAYMNPTFALVAGSLGSIAAGYKAAQYICEDLDDSYGDFSAENAPTTLKALAVFAASFAPAALAAYSMI
jgi:hypothetical protein